MKQLVLLRGAMGAGKSTFIRENNLTQYTLSADDIRMLFQTPVLGINGKPEISPKHDREVWEFLFQLLEKRMQRGEFTIIDATHQKTELIQRYKELCSKYRYRCTVVDFTDIPMEQALTQNKMRPVYKQVPEIAIRNAYSRFPSQPVPGWVNIIKPGDFGNTFQYRPTDHSAYERVHIFGDLQGCWTVVEEYFNTNSVHPNTHHDHLFIFAGDLVDRGIENDKVVSEMLKLYGLKNVIIVRGNHDDHLDDWSNNRPLKSKEFEYNTKPQLEKANIDKKLVREMARRFSQIVFFTYDDKAVLVTHGGVSTMPENLIYIATEQFVKGVGKYEDDIDNIFTDNTKNLYWDAKDGKLREFRNLVDGQDSNIWQIHGHRNLAGLPVQAGPRSFNLEGKVEYGGHLRVVTLDHTNGWVTHEIKNTVQGRALKKVGSGEPATSGTLLANLRANKKVEEKIFGNISSFNFSRNVFWDKTWDAMNVKARGLFINTVTEEIVARSYDKFFNVNEVFETKVEQLQLNLKFPVTAYDKPNGFLGITGYDSESDQLIIASKSTLTGEFKQWFEEILLETLGDKVDEFKQALKDENLSATFEVIDPINDPHIIEYSKREVILLDLVHRAEKYGKADYKDVQLFGNRFGLKTKEKVETFDNWAEFYGWYVHNTSDDTLQKEGYVIEDSEGFMTKIKLPWYSFWKMLRGLKMQMSQKGNPKIRGGMLTTPVANAFHLFLKGKDREEIAAKDIITLRKEFEIWSAEKTLVISENQGELTEEGETSKV